MIYPTLTKEQVEYLKRKIADDVGYYEDGEIREGANEASAIYQQLLTLEAVECRNLWVTLYSIETAYGGPEEGGWTYDNYQVVDSFGVSNSKSAIKAWSTFAIEVLGRVDFHEQRWELWPKDEELNECFTKEDCQVWPHRYIQPICSNMKYLLCIEPIRGYQTTWRRPIYC